MKLELLKVHKYPTCDNHFLEFKLDNSSSKFEWFEFTSLDVIESIELQLTEIVQKLYDYRKQQGEQQNDCS